MKMKHLPSPEDLRRQCWRRGVLVAGMVKNEVGGGMSSALEVLRNL